MFQENIPLAQFSNYKIGGPARYFAAPMAIDQLTAVIKEARQLEQPIFILGGGFNLLISDQGFNGVVIKPALNHITIEDGNKVRVGAGALVSELLDFCVKNSLSGFEWAGGLPSSVGGAIWGNAGAFGGETKDRVVEVLSLDINPNEPLVVRRTKEQCQFGYRSSIFKTSEIDGHADTARINTHEIIIEAVFSFEKGDPSAISAKIEEKKQYRRDRQPLEYPNIGSIFKNIPVEKVPPPVLEKFKAVVKHDPFPVLPAAALISDAGLKEYKYGGAMVSPKHPNFVINVGSATSSDVRAVMQKVRDTIKEKYGIELEQEVIFVGEGL